MGYRSEVRIITTKEGYEKLKLYVKEYIENKVKPEERYNLLENCDIEEKDDKMCYLGWNYIKWYDNCFPEVDAIEDGLNKLEEDDISYRFARIGEDYDDIEEKNYDSSKENDFIEYPDIIRQFNDEYILDMIHNVEQSNEDKEMEKEGIDI